MRYREIKDAEKISSDEILSSLLNDFPEFAKSANLKGGPYSLLGEFAIYLRNGIVNSSFSSKEMDRAFSLLNIMGSSAAPELQNQLVVGVLEILTDNSECIRTARIKLKDQALDMFERVLSGWNAG